MATTRFRKAFKYPADDDSNEHDEIDEEGKLHLSSSGGVNRHPSSRLSRKPEHLTMS